MDVDEQVEVDVEEKNLYENVIADPCIPDDPDQTMNSDEEDLDGNPDIIQSGENNSLLTVNYEPRNLFNEEHNIPSSSTVNKDNSLVCNNDMIAMEHEICKNDVEKLQDEYSHIEDIDMEPSNASMKSADDVSIDSGTKHYASENVENTNSVCLNEESNISMISETERETLNTDGSDQDLIDDQDERIHTEDNHPSIYDDDNAQPASTIGASMDEIHHDAEDSINFPSHCATKVDKTNDVLDENFKLDEKNNVLISIKTNQAENFGEVINESEIQSSELPKDLYQQIDNEDGKKSSTNNELTSSNGSESIRMQSTSTTLASTEERENETVNLLKNIQEENDKSPKHYEKILPISIIPVSNQNNSDEHITFDDKKENKNNNKLNSDQEKMNGECSATVADLCDDNEAVVLEQDEYGFKDSESSLLQITRNEKGLNTDIDHSDDEKMNINEREVNSKTLSSEANDHCIELIDEDDSENIHKINLYKAMKLDQKVAILSVEINNSEKLENSELENSQEGYITIDQTMSSDNDEVEIANSDHCRIISENKDKQIVNAVLDNEKLDNSENKSLKADSYKNNDKLCIDLTLEDECKNEFNINISPGETSKIISNQQEPENTENKMNQEKCQSQTDPRNDDDDSDSCSDGKSDTYIDISKFLINFNNKKESDHNKKILYDDDDKSIEWISDSEEDYMEGRESVENSVSDIVEDRPQSGSRSLEMLDNIANNNMITDNVQNSNNEADKLVENINKDESTKDNKDDKDFEIEHTSEEILKGNEYIEKTSDIEKNRLQLSLTTKKEDSLDVAISKGVKENKTDTINQHMNSSFSFKFIDKNTADEELADNKNDKKQIIAIISDGLDKSSSKVFPFFEIPGEDIKDGIFTRVVIIGEHFISSYSKTWPMNFKFKPYFLYKEKISIYTFYSKICDHPYLKNSKNILVLFMLGVHDMAKYAKFKSPTCTSSHLKLKIVRKLNYRPHSCLKYISEMLTLKKKLEAGKALSCIFCYLPLVNFRSGVEDTCALSRQKSKSCLCLPSICKHSGRKIFTASENSLLNMNQKIFYKNLNETKESGVFEFMPDEVAFQEGAWILTKGQKSENNVKLFRLLLNKYLFYKEDGDEDSAFIKKELRMMKNKLIGQNPFKILIIGDTWIKCIAEEYDIYKKIQPHFYCKDGLTLNDIENLILSISDSDNILVISTIPFGEFFNISHFSECKDHTPLQYPVPVNDLLDDPLKYADHISKKIELFFINIKEKREKCKVVFLTCYPVSFNTCYKYLLDAHIASNSSHVSTGTLIDEHNLSDFDSKVEKCFKKLNKQIVNINKENNLLTCNIFSLVAKLSSKEMFLFPIYIQNKCPPQSIEEKLQELFYQYIQSLYKLMIDTNYSFENEIICLNEESSYEKRKLEERKIDAKEDSDKNISKSTEKETAKKQDVSSSQNHSSISSNKKMEKLNSNERSSLNDETQKLSDKLHASKVARYPDKLNTIKNSSRYAYKSTSRSNKSSKYGKETVHAESIYPIRSITEQLREEYNIYDVNYSEMDYRDRHFPDDNRRSPSYRLFYGYHAYPPPSDRRFSRNESRERRRSGSKNTTRKRSRSGDRSRSRNRRSRSKEANRYISGRRSWSRSRSKSNSRSEWRASATKSSRVKRSTKKRRSRSPTPKDLILNEHCTSTEKTAIVSLWNIHLKECEMYRKFPNAHPDHDRVKQKWLDVMTSQGLNTSNPSILEHWREYWAKKMENLFQDSWEEKKEKCLDVLYSKSRLKDSSDSCSSSTDSSSDSLSDSKRSKKSKHKRKSKKKSRKKSKRDKRQSSKGKTPSIDLSLKPAEKLVSRVNEFMMNTQDSKMAPPAIQPLPVAPPNQKLFKPLPRASSDKDRENLLEITSILCQISDRFGALGKSLTTLHDEAVKCFQNKLNPLDCIDEDAKMLLDLIGDKIRKILDSSDLNVVQRAIIQEAHDRLMPFLESYDKNKASPVNLNIDYLASATLGKQVSEIIGFVREHFVFSGHKNVTNEELMGVYLEIKSHQIKLVNQIDDMISQARHKPQSLASSTVNLISGYPHLQGIPSTSNINQMISMRGVRIREEFLALSLQEKIEKFAQFHTLPFEERSFLLSHLDELEKTDKNLTESLRVMILRSKPT